jgi:hypothetical protein
VSANGQVAQVVKLQLSIYMVQLVAIQSKQLISTTMQLHYNYTHDVILTSLIVIHILKSNTWHYEDFWT